MLTGKGAFRHNTPVESMNAVLKDEPSESIVPGLKLPPALARIVSHCLEKEPGHRFQSAQDVSFALEIVRDDSTPTQTNRDLAASPGRMKTMAPALAVGLILLVLGVAAGWLVARLKSRSSSGTGTVLRNLTHSGSDFSPAASPDGRYVCFRSDRDGTNKLWLKDLASWAEKPLTEGSDDVPRFSADGSAILFARQSGSERALFRVPSLGGEPQKIIGNAFAGDWSPDGGQVAFVRWDTNTTTSSLNVIRVDGSGEYLLHEFKNQRFAFPRWSPDGQRIAVSGYIYESNPQLALVTVATRAVEIIKLQGPFLVSAPAWDRRSQELIYMQAESAGGELTSSAGSIFRQAPGGVAEKIGWSPTFSVGLDLLPANRVVFGARSQRENLREIRLGTGSKGEAEDRFLTRGSSNDRQPTYSHDGEVIFSSNRSGNLDLWSISCTNKSLKRLTDDPADDWDPALSPDGRHLLWSSNSTGQFETWMANPDGTNPHQVTHGGLDCENPCMTPNGDWILYIIVTPGKVGIWKIRPDGTQATQLTSSYRGSPEISPDGKYVASFFSSSVQHVVRVLSLETGKLDGFEIALPIQRQTSVALPRLRWMPGGGAIAFLGQDEHGNNGVYVQDFVPGKDTTASRRKLGGFDRDNSTESFAISPDGQQLTIAAWEQLFSIVATEPIPSL
jgi:TolB protein